MEEREKAAVQNRPLRMMQLISSLEIGGAQEVVRTLAEYLAECGHSLLVCTYKDGPLRLEIERLGIPVMVLPGRRHSILAFPSFAADMLRIRQDLVKLVEAHRIDVIQTHLLRTLDYLVLSLRFRKKPPLVFWTVHNYNFALRPEHLPNFKWLLGPKRLAYRLLFRLSARWVNGVIAVSEDVGKSILAQVGPIQDKVTVISNGVDARRYAHPEDRAAVRRQLGFAEDELLMSVVGTLKEQKGHRYLIEAAGPVIARFPNLHILIIGDGALREALQAQASAAGLEGNIHFLGSRNDVPALLSASDLFVLPSLWEGLAMALIEAMASSLPIVATAVSGSQQVMIHEETGLLVPPGDAERLCEGILQLLSNADRARAMGEAARRRVEVSFSAKKQAQEHADLFYKEWSKNGG